MVPKYGIMGSKAYKPRKSNSHKNQTYNKLLRGFAAATSALALSSLINGPIRSANSNPVMAGKGKESNVTLISRIRSRHKVFITMDDGWFPNRDVLKLIERDHIPTTTFLIGKALEEHREFWREYSRFGSIQNHTLSHPFLTRISDKEVIRQVGNDQAMIDNLTGDLPYMLRPPYGAYNKRVIRDASISGIRYVVMWSAEVPIGRDGYVGEPFKLETYNGKGLETGEIILMHWDPGMYPAFKRLLRVIKRDGLTVGSLENRLRR